MTSPKSSAAAATVTRDSESPADLQDAQLWDTGWSALPANRSHTEPCISVLAVCLLWRGGTEAWGLRLSPPPRPVPRLTFAAAPAAPSLGPPRHLPPPERKTLSRSGSARHPPPPTPPLQPPRPRAARGARRGIGASEDRPGARGANPPYPLPSLP